MISNQRIRLNDYSDMTEEDWEKVTDVAKAVGDKCGLHLNACYLTPGPEGTVMVVCTYLVGELAFSSRILDPGSEVTNDIVRDMDIDMEEEALEEMRKKFENLKKNDEG